MHMPTLAENRTRATEHVECPIGSRGGGVGGAVAGCHAAVGLVDVHAAAEPHGVADLEKHGERVENATWSVKRHVLTL